MNLKKLIARIIFYSNAIFLIPLWIVCPKKKEIIHKIEIVYVSLPLWIRLILLFLIRQDGYVFYIKKWDRIFIFISSSARFRRCIIWHEYCEGQFLRKINLTAAFSFILERLDIILTKIYLKPSLPINEEKLKKKVNRWLTKRIRHIIALCEEIELAYEELDPKEISLFLRDIREKDRFCIKRMVL